MDSVPTSEKITKATIQPSKRIIVALDYAKADQALALVDKLDPQLCRLKVGKELFTASGPDLVKDIVGRGFELFLDLKFHDIPHTVAKAVAAAAELGVWMINIHASGGKVMMEQAVAALKEFGEDRPLLIGVTVLTSMAKADLQAIGIDAEPADQVLRLASLSEQAGLDGVVCSAAEAKILRNALGQDFYLVTPGIRRPEDAPGDQKRVVSPLQALQNGSDFLVVGRPITQAESPIAALQAFISSISGVS